MVNCPLHETAPAEPFLIGQLAKFL